MEPITYETTEHDEKKGKSRRKRYWIIVLSAFFGILILFYGTMVLPPLLSGNDSPINSWSDHNIPLYSNEIFQTRTFYKVPYPKDNNETFYYEKRVYYTGDLEQKVKAFYIQALPGFGWKLTQANPATASNPAIGDLTADLTFKRNFETLDIGLVANQSSTVISMSYNEITTN